jgi:anti-anti-sigma factor
MKTTHYLVAPRDFDRQTAIHFKHSTLEKLSFETTTLEIDLKGTHSFDSNGLSALLAIKDSLAKRKGQVRLISPSPEVTQLLELTGMHRLFVISIESLASKNAATRPILVVEDESIIRSVAEMSLNALGRPIVFAANGQEAITIARNENPVIILLDYIMPLMDGNETLRRLKSEDSTKDIPVIIMSANEKIASGVYDKFEGASCFVSKPFSPSALRGEVHRLIQENPELAAS